MKTLDQKDELELAAFRMPPQLKSEAKTKCKAEDITFSQLMRRAIRKELNWETAQPAKEGK